MPYVTQAVLRRSPRAARACRHVGQGGWHAQRRGAASHSTDAGGVGEAAGTSVQSRAAEAEAEVARLNAQLSSLQADFERYKRQEVHKGAKPALLSGAPGDERRRFNILSLDGGGARGLFTAIVLARLTKEIPDLLSKIDLVAGTSSGGIIASLLVLGVQPDEIVKTFESVAPVRTLAALSTPRPAAAMCAQHTSAFS